MTGADVTRFGTAVPEGAPSPAGAEGAPGPQRTTVDANGQRVADTHAAPEPAPPAPQARTQGHAPADVKIGRRLTFNPDHHAGASQ